MRRPQPVKALLVDRGLKQRDVAPVVGVHAVTLNQVVNRKREAWPALRARLSEYLGVPESDLFDERG